MERKNIVEEEEIEADDESEGTMQSRVAWADRLGLTKRWAEDIDRCTEAYGLREVYVNRVDAFVNDLVDVRKGPALHTMTMDYWNDVLVPRGKAILHEWKSEYKLEARIEEEASAQEEEIRIQLAQDLCHYIIQLLEAYGFGTYKSSITEDDVSLNR